MRGTLALPELAGSYRKREVVGLGRSWEWAAPSLSQVVGDCWGWSWGGTRSMCQNCGTSSRLVASAVASVSHNEGSTTTSPGPFRTVTGPHCNEWPSDHIFHIERAYTHFFKDLTLDKVRRYFIVKRECVFVMPTYILQMSCRKTIKLGDPYRVIFSERLQRVVTSADKYLSRLLKSILGLTAASLIDRNWESQWRNRKCYLEI